MKFRSKKIFVFFLSFLFIFMITVTPFGANALDISGVAGNTFVPDLSHNSLDYTSWDLMGFSGSDLNQPFGVYANGDLFTFEGIKYPFIFIEFNLVNIVVVNVVQSGEHWYTTTNTLDYIDCATIHFREFFSDGRDETRLFFEQHMTLMAYPYPLSYSYNLIVMDGTVVYNNEYEQLRKVFKPKYLDDTNIAAGRACYVLDNSNTLIRNFDVAGERPMISLFYDATPNTTMMKVYVFDARDQLIETVDLLNFDYENIKTYSSGCTFVFLSDGDSGEVETLNSAPFMFYVDTDTISETIDSAYEQGYDEGYDVGFNAGVGDSANYQLGYDTGYNEGYIKGGDDVRPVAYQEGYNAGYNVGLGDGINSNEAYQNGYETGYSQGHHIGSSEAWGENILGSAFEKPIELINGFTLFSVGDVDVTLGGVVGCVIALTLFIVFLKMFAGG